MMESEIYNACRHNDINFVRALIETCPNGANINILEPNGSTALHLVCSNGYTNIARLLLNDHRVDRHQTDRNGRTAYQVASTEDIRQFFSRHGQSDNPFCTDETALNPMEIFINENSSDSHYTTYYPSEAPINSECLHRVYTEDYNTITLPAFNALRRFFGNDPEKKKVDKWVEDLQVHLTQCFTAEDCQLRSADHSSAYKCIEGYQKTRNVENLLRLYTLHTTICAYFSQDSTKTNDLCAPILFHLSSIGERAYEGLSFRGLTMKENEFKKYKRALYTERSFIRTNTFCSTSVDPSVAEMFIDPRKTSGIINVIIKFEFVKKCSTAIALFSSSSKIKCVSQYEDEKEVLILPGTIFSVINIQEDDQVQYTTIHLKKFDATEIEHEISQARFENYIENMFTD
ncbi:unnamed protein product [Adineta ricciae]|uniref:Uncharacterized protein n=1 Tax=Adineta ricciae TaxID=249248 RepID=A0A815RD56_ADIRI|nr:unnamed protein product [Adineta ricciae]CAF1473583.1 unnamed protein product [Adineta ricciae]